MIFKDYVIAYLFFFFSSRRRHTRWPRDWSSDVCSSDLPAPHLRVRGGAGDAGQGQRRQGTAGLRGVRAPAEIGRASCRERVWISVGGGSVERKTDNTDSYGPSGHVKSNSKRLRVASK